MIQQQSFIVTFINVYTHFTKLCFFKAYENLRFSNFPLYPRGRASGNSFWLKSGCISATVVVRVVATSSCGSSNTKYIYVTVGSDPCPPALRLSQNPVKDGNLVANVIYPPDCDPNARVSNTIISNEIKIYDFNGTVVYTSKQHTDELNINNLQIKKGIYLLQVITEKGEIIKDKIIIE